MRRSSAPSQRSKISSIPIGNSLRKSDIELCSSSVFQQNKCLPIDSGCPVAEEEFKITPELRVFCVVYGKQTKKKHKTWEGDGFLEIGQKSVTLKDEDGKVIGQSSQMKTDGFVEGSRLFVGSKEVEIIELLKGEINVNKRPSSPVEKCETNEPLKKKSKGTCLNTLLLANTPKMISTTKKKQLFLTPSFDSFVLPRPPEEHQWHFNEDHLPISDVCIEGSLAKVLRPHQKEGVTFLYKCVLGLRSTNHTGCILADEMGLGKTLQCISLIWTLLKQGPYGGKPVIKTVLIIVPSSLVKNWKNEFVRWLGSYRINIFTVDKDHRIQDCPRNVLRPPVIVASYDMFVRNFDDIKDISFDLLICDEGHRLKNNNIKTTTLLNELPCKRRILLSGTPIQNDLQEFFTLVNFVNPNILGSYAEFRKNFELPIEASRELKASDEIISEGERKARELSLITNSFILRRTQSVIGGFLPPKNEYVIICPMTNFQTNIYNLVVNFWENKNANGDNDSIDHFSIITILKKICNHPFLLKFISKVAVSSLVEELLLEISNLQEGCFVNISTKFLIIESLLKVTLSLNEKIILVSNYTQTLDLLEQLLKNQNYKYYRFDGSTSMSNRNDIVNSFNSTTSQISILLLTSKAGGVGLNLVGASRLILIDSDWNPATDLQAMARIWREGQKKKVHIYRLLMSGTIEEKIFQRQLKKAGLSESVVDPKSVSAVKLSKEELKDIFSYQGNDRCTTHELLHCKCDGSGCVPGLPDLENQENIEEEVRDSEIILAQQHESPSLRMNQLFLWQHHSKPISTSVLQEIGLGDVNCEINFIFKNTAI